MMLKKIAIVAGLGLALSAAAEAQTPRKGGTIRMTAPYGSSFSSMDIHTTQRAQDEIFAKGLHRSLYIWDSAEGKPVPELAKEATVSGGGLVYTFKLRDDAYFHHGRKMTADDVIWSFNRIMDGSRAYPGARFVRVIEGAAEVEKGQAKEISGLKKIDDFTLEMKLTEKVDPGFYFFTDPDAVRDASGRSDEEVVVALEELLARGVLVEADDETLDFRHEQERLLVQEGTTLARRRLLHRRVAAALGGRGRRELHATVIAHHLELAGDEAAAAELYRVAGDRARSLYANSEALGHYRVALALGFPEQAVLHKAIGDLETLAGDYGAALSSYQTAAALAPSELGPEIEHRIGALHLRRGDWELAEASLAAALEGLDGAAAARATADRSLAARRRGLPEEAARLAAEALAQADKTEIPAPARRPATSSAFSPRVAAPTQRLSSNWRRASSSRVRPRTRKQRRPR